MKILLALLALTPLLAACTTADVRCPICYEDEWSREPFPGQPKQHIATPDPKIAPAVEPDTSKIPTNPNNN
jgi:hypothetical protein